jgi:hypothetical protein
METTDAIARMRLADWNVGIARRDTSDAQSVASVAIPPLPADRLVTTAAAR